MAFVCDIPASATTLQDDENVRITRWDFPPGAVTGWHAHGWRYTIVMLTNAVMKIHNGKDVVDASFNAGDSYARPAGVEHDVMNAANEPLSFIEIEYKRN